MTPGSPHNGGAERQKKNALGEQHRLGTGRGGTDDTFKPTRMQRPYARRRHARIIRLRGVPPAFSHIRDSPRARRAARWEARLVEQPCHQCDTQRWLRRRRRRAVAGARTRRGGAISSDAHASTAGGFQRAAQLPKDRRERMEASAPSYFCLLYTSPSPRD